MSAMGQHVFELQEFVYDLLNDPKLNYEEARKVFVQKYKGAGYLFDELADNYYKE